MELTPLQSPHSMRSLFLWILVTTLSASALPVFRAPFPVPLLSQQVEGIRSADFDGDHHPDLLVRFQDHIGVYLANGVGPFAPPIDTALSAPFDVGIADVNRDGRADVLVTGRISRTATILLSDGHGGFTVGATLATGIYPQRAVACDFNGDSFPDVAVLEQTIESGPGTTIEVFQNDGLGHFARVPALSTFSAVAKELVAADMNRDGKDDLIVTFNDGNSFVVLGSGDGTFRTVSSDRGASVALPAIQDFNHDGIPDFASTKGRVVEVSLGNGDGTLGAPASFDAVYHGRSIATGDADGDGNLDILVVGEMGSSVGVLRGDGLGSFRSPDIFLSGPRPWEIVAGDFDGDGRLDFITEGHADTFEALTFVSGNGDGTFKTSRAYRNYVSDLSTADYGFTLGSDSHFQPADMNHDERQDIVVISKRPGMETANLGVMLNDGHGGLLAPVMIDVPALGSIAVADMNHDGNLDVVVSGSALVTWLGDGTGHLSNPVSSPAMMADRIVLSECNGDGEIDLVAIGWNSITVYVGGGDGTFAPGMQIAFDSGAEGFAIVGDLNGDRLSDLVIRTSWQTNAYLNDGHGGFVVRLIDAGSTGDPILADFNNDGKLDLFLVDVRDFRTLLGNGDGTFSASVITSLTYGTTVESGGAVTGDVDRDGNEDVILGSSIFFGTGDGHVRAGEQFRTKFIAENAVADMDGNGSLDVILQKMQADEIDVLLTYTGTDPAQTTAMDASWDEPAEYARAINFTASVSGGPAPRSGPVTFRIDGRPAVLADIAGGEARAAISLPVGQHELTVEYPGDAYHLPSSVTKALPIARATTTLWIAGSPNPQAKGRTVTITVTNNRRPFATGTITLYDGDRLLDVPLTDGVARVTTLDIGTHVIRAEYSGDANYTPATASYTQTITKPIPSIFLTSIPANFLAGSSVTLRVVSSSAGLTGTMSFYEYDALLSTVPLVQGVAEFATTFQPGNHEITARYSGDETYAPSADRENFYAQQAWGTPIQLHTSGTADYLSLWWYRLDNATSYTIWRKTKLLNAWEPVVVVSGDSYGASMPERTTWLFAITATNASGQVSLMSAPQLVTTAPRRDESLLIKAQHFIDVRAVIQSVRTFANLQNFVYTNSLQPGMPVRAVDVSEMRTALVQALMQIGLPAPSFTDSTLMPQSTRIRQVHLLELISATNRSLYQ